MRELRILKWCDHCLLNDQQTEATEELVITVGERGKSKVLDLCQVCHKDIAAPVIDMLNDLGRRPGSTVAARPKLPGTSLRYQPPPPTVQHHDHDGGARDEDWTCPLCSSVMQRKRASGHIWQVHRKGEKKPTYTRCPECGDSHATPLAMAIHRARAHHVDLIEEALHGIKKGRR